ncbi:MAG TPA: L-threonylcarbamoyladenylate synthase [Gaiellaceae bacterium]|nr:L-threonylcarbamoyladenylate synthase [Gaiellaceae bacterium]
MSSVDDVVAALEAGKLVVIPTDTVYGLACRPDREDAVLALSRLKQRSPEQPIALVASGVGPLRELIPELPVDELVRGALTLVLPNPGQRLPWLGGAGTIGVRVPEVTGLAAELLAKVGVVAATSANLHGGADPTRVGDIPREILDGVAAVLDVGALPGTPSTVVDLSGAEPRVLREGAVSAAEALARMAGALED